MEFKDHSLLSENGRPIVLNWSWTESLLKQIGFVKRKGTKADRKLPMNFKDLKCEFFFLLWKKLKWTKHSWITCSELWPDDCVNYPLRELDDAQYRCVFKTSFNHVNWLKFILELRLFMVFVGYGYHILNESLNISQKASGQCRTW